MDPKAIRYSDINLVTGKRGTGKTYFVKTYIRDLLLKHIKVFVWDPLHQYGDLGKTVSQLASIQDRDMMDNSVAIVFQPSLMDDTKEVFDDVVGYVFRRQNIVLVAEELNEYMTPTFIPPNFRAFIRRGRNYNLGLVGITHRPAWLSLNFINNIDHWYIFQQDLKVDLDRLYEYIERAAPQYDQDYIATMPDRHFLHMRRDRTTGRSEVTAEKPIVAKTKTKTEVESDVKDTGAHISRAEAPDRGKEKGDRPAWEW